MKFCAILRERVSVCIHFVRTCTPHVFPESQWNERKNAESSLPAETDSISQKHIETLSQICRTHHRYTTTHQRNIYQVKSRHSDEVWWTCSTLLKQTDTWEETWILFILWSANTPSLKRSWTQKQTFHTLSLNVYLVKLRLWCFPHISTDTDFHCKQLSFSTPPMPFLPITFITVRQKPFSTHFALL